MNHRTFVKSMKHIAVLGSTGSIGTQTLEVVAAHPEKFCVEVLTANTHWELLAEQARRFKPDCVVIAEGEGVCRGGCHCTGGETVTY